MFSSTEHLQRQNNIQNLSKIRKTYFLNVFKFVMSCLDLILNFVHLTLAK